MLGPGTIDIGQFIEKVLVVEFEIFLNRLSAFSLSQIATISVLLEAIGGIMDERLSEKERE